MLSFLTKWLLNRRTTLRVEAYHFSRPIKLPKPVVTGFRRRVTVVYPIVDVDYCIDKGSIVVHDVRMSQSGTSIGGSSCRVNVMSWRGGEAFYVQSLSPSSLLMQRVLEDVCERRGYLRRTMYAQWRRRCPWEVRPVLVAALNQQLPAEHIRHLIGNEGVFGDVAFSYDSPKRGVEERVVTVHSVQGESLQATDRKDGNPKTFRMDRISNVRPA